MPYSESNRKKARAKPSEQHPSYHLWWHWIYIFPFVWIVCKKTDPVGLVSPKNGFNCPRRPRQMNTPSVLIVCVGKRASFLPTQRRTVAQGFLRFLEHRRSQKWKFAQWNKMEKIPKWKWNKRENIPKRKWNKNEIITPFVFSSFYFIFIFEIFSFIPFSFRDCFHFYPIWDFHSCDFRASMNLRNPRPAVLFRVSKMWPILYTRFRQMGYSFVWVASGN